jgi:hypothetical protein
VLQTIDRPFREKKRTADLGLYGSWVGLLRETGQPMRRARVENMVAGATKPASFGKPPRGAASMRSREAMSPGLNLYGDFEVKLFLVLSVL